LIGLTWQEERATLFPEAAVAMKKNYCKDWLHNYYWPSPAQSFLVPSSTGLTAIIFTVWYLWEPQTAQCKDMTYAVLYTIGRNYATLEKIDCCSVDHCWSLYNEQHWNPFPLLVKPVATKSTFSVWVPSSRTIIFLNVPSVQFYLNYWHSVEVVNSLYWRNWHFVFCCSPEGLLFWDLDTDIWWVI
jgi:hypothetical protein